MKPYFLIMLLSLPALTFGQSKNISLGLDIAIPGSTLQASAGTGIGFSMQYQHPITNHVAAIGTIGYVSFAEKTFSSAKVPITLVSKTSLIPMQIGVYYFLNSAQNGAFFSGELGLTSLFEKLTINGKSIDVPIESDFSYAPGLGYRFKDFEFAYRQQFITNSGKSIVFANFRIAYVFSL